MCLPSSFPISASQINVELGRATNYPFDPLGSAELALSGQAGAPNSWSNFLGKCNTGITKTFSSFSGGNSWNSVPIGSAQTNRRLYIALIAGYVANDPGNSPTLTVGGANATLLGANSTGDASPANFATGEAWFSINATGTTANISASWASMSNFGILVMPTYGYTTFKGYEADGGAQGGSDGQVGSLLNTVNGGALLAVTTYSSVQSPTWAQLTGQQTWTLGWSGSTSNTGGLAWLANITASQVWNVSPHPAGYGSYMSGWISLAP